MVATEAGKTSCLTCGCANLDALEEHLVALWGAYGYFGPPIFMPLCANCHQAIHLYGWVPPSEESKALFGRYLALLDDLPGALPRALRGELDEAKGTPRDFMADDPLRAVRQAAPSAASKCPLCSYSNSNVIRGFPAVLRGEFGHQGNSIMLELCANCRKIIRKFYYHQDVLSEMSKTLFQSYLGLLERVPTGVMKKLLALS